MAQERQRGRIVKQKGKKPWIQWYDASNSKEWKESVFAVARVLADRQGWRMRKRHEPVQVAIFIHPRATKKGEAPLRPGDADNHAKAILDALQGVLYEDDQAVRPLLVDFAPPTERGVITAVVADRTPEIGAQLRELFGI